MGTTSEIVEPVTKEWELKNWSKHHRLLTSTRTFSLEVAEDVTLRFSLKPYIEPFQCNGHSGSLEFYSLCVAVETARDEIAFRVSGTLTPVYNQPPSYPVTDFNFESQGFYSATSENALEPIMLEEKLIFMLEKTLNMEYAYTSDKFTANQRFCKVDELHFELTARIVDYIVAVRDTIEEVSALMPTKKTPKLKGDGEFQDFGNVLYETDGPNFYDVHLKMADDVVLPAHRVILSARSPVFRAMFISTMKESGEGNTIEITDLHSPAMKVILEFIYTGKVDDAWKDNVAEVVRAASKYLLKRLLIYCDKNLIQVCDSKNAMELYRIANLYSLNTAMRQVTAYIHKHTTNVLKSMTLE